ncbi:DUF4229 domain-containing protein [Demetria terragena]|uniref:DUF4229 domain-containing protein n=1 Tax=Demetria terragena TaxID=63959 RepID=UPI00035D0054|nr:DUF4229 domain-containing protein [Demetria terragena]
MRYTVLRLFVFFAVLLILWLLGMRGILLLGVSAIASAIVSVFLLVGPREEFAAKIEGKVAQRRAKAEENRTFEDDED